METPSTSTQPCDGLKNTSWAQARIGYRNRTMFLAAMRRDGIPYIQINSRVFRFDPNAIDAWLKSRTVGGVR